MILAIVSGVYKPTYNWGAPHRRIWYRIYIYTDWWFGFFPYIGNVIIPTDFHIFQRGRYTTNHIYIHNIWDNPSHWLSYFSRWLKPPTSIIYIFIIYRSLITIPRGPSHCCDGAGSGTAGGGRPAVKFLRLSPYENQAIYGTYIYYYGYIYMVKIW